jgi:hypothetical protein
MYALNAIENEVPSDDDDSDEPEDPEEPAKSNIIYLNPWIEDSEAEAASYSCGAPSGGIQLTSDEDVPDYIVTISWSGGPAYFVDWNVPRQGVSDWPKG